jgi:hypothetical protein
MSNPNQIIATITSQLSNYGVSQDQISGVIGGLNLQNIGADMIQSQLPELLKQANIPTEAVSSIVGNVLKDGFQIEDITGSLKPEDVIGKFTNMISDFFDGK